MPFPRKLLTSTEKDILKEISMELKIPINDVNKTFKIWIDYLKSINDDTDQSTVNFPGLGKMFISYARLKGNDNVEWEQKKKNKIIKDIPEDKINDHKSVVPVNIIYGVGRRNHKLGRNKKGLFDFFTKEELIRRQNNNFFKEDFEFNERKSVYNDYFSDIEEQKLIDYENLDNNKSKTKE